VSYWRGKRVTVTGGAGLLGCHLVQALREHGCDDPFVVRSRDYDLTKEDAAVRLLETTRPDVVFHLAGAVGGIRANRERPASFFYDNLTMGTFLLHHAQRLGVRRFVAAGPGCGYPERAPLPLREESLWDGPPQAETAPYALAKRLLHIQAQAYYEQYGFVSIIAIPGNLYGPHDKSDPAEATVIPSLVAKFVLAVEAQEESVRVWGSGDATRDFIYAGDAALGILATAEKYDRAEVVNLSSGEETSIRELAEVLTEVTGFRGRVVWDADQPEGQQRRRFDITKARRDLGFAPRVSLREGLQRTVEWYCSQRATPVTPGEVTR